MSLLGVDVGTSGCKAAAFGARGVCLAIAQREYPTLHPQSGWAQLDAQFVWRKVKEAIAEAAARTTGDPVVALCVSSMGEALVPLSAGRQILGPSILQSDSRGGSYVESLRSAIGQERFYEINPNILGTNYSLPKLLWIRDHEPELYERADWFLPWADAAAFLLGGESMTSYSLANRTLLFDIRGECWSRDILNWSGLDAGKLPPVVPSGTLCGTVSPAVADELGLPRGARLVVGGHDQGCNSLGAGLLLAGGAVCGLGTFECITPTYDRLPPSAAMLELGLNIEHHVLPGLYVSFIYNQAGSLVRWFRDTFASAELRAAGAGTRSDIAGAEPRQAGAEAGLYSLLAREMPPHPTGLLTLPYFEMTGPPGYVSDAGGAIVNLKTSTTRGEILKSIMECETLYFFDSLQTLRTLGIPTSRFIATGGGARSDEWLQIKADIFGVPFVRPAFAEGSVLGAAILAGVAVGILSSPAEGVEIFVRQDRLFEPDASRHRQYQDMLQQYRKLLPALRSLLKDLQLRTTATA